jgi:hypothetical protein
MHRLRWSERRIRANTAVYSATNTGPRRPDKTARTGADSGSAHAHEPFSTSGNKPDKSNCSAGHCRNTAGNAIADTAGR